MTDILTAPSPRVRSRRRLDLSAAPVPAETPGGMSNVETVMAQLRAKALEHIEAIKAANKATSEAAKALKELAALAAEHEIETFDVAFGRDTYDCQMFTDIANEPDVALLREQVSDEEFMKLVKTTQGAVKDHGGEVLLNRCLKAVTKDPAYKVRKRK